MTGAAARDFAGTVGVTGTVAIGVATVLTGITGWTGATVGATAATGTTTSFGPPHQEQNLASSGIVKPQEEHILAKSIH